jgi:tRNA pseudouridine55 synthase
MATGVLPLVTGRMTRLAQFYTTANKSYSGEIRFGISTDTYDADGDPVRECSTAEFAGCDLNLARIREVALAFTGTLQQTPPPFSAKKIAGVPAYKLARKNKEVELKPVAVRVERLEIHDFAGDRARFSCDVSSGTYVRSIAHELGQKIGCGAHLSSLRRTTAGEFRIEDAVALAELDLAMQDGSVHKYFIHPRKLLPEFPSVTADEENLAKIRHGRAVNLPELSRARQVKVFQGQSELVAIATRVAGTLFQPKVVLAEVAD